VFERFTERARQVVVLAQEEARLLRHNYIGTEHILLGLLREEEGVAAEVLESLDITAERVRYEVVRIVGRGEEVVEHQNPFTPRAKKVLELALREGLSLGHNYIGTEHILLGLARENEGVAARILLDFNADAETIRNEVIRMLSGPGARRRRRFRLRTRADAPYVRPLDEPVPPASVSYVESPPGDDVGAMLAKIERQIRGLLGREPDNGDLLVILATLPEGVVSRALAELGVSDEALDAALAKARAAGPDSIDDQIELARRRKDEAIDREDFAAAAERRGEERRLERELEADLIGRVRERLRLVPPGPRAAPASVGPAEDASAAEASSAPEPSAAETADPPVAEDEA
jgi:ATP-dependent Clp protease ATP-binding subunit ClpC